MPKHTDATVKCPICDKLADAKFRPFCSKRCADVDLGRWLKGNYAIPAEEPPDDVAETIFDELPHRGRDV